MKTKRMVATSERHRRYGGSHEPLHVRLRKKLPPERGPGRLALDAEERGAALDRGEQRLLVLWRVRAQDIRVRDDLVNAAT